MHWQPGREGQRGGDRAAHPAAADHKGAVAGNFLPLAQQAAHEALAVERVSGEPPVGLGPHRIGRLRDGGSGVT